MTQTTAKKHRQASPTENILRQAAKAIGRLPKRNHRIWLALLLLYLRDEGVDVELLECALAEQ